jgi:predicted permease
MLDTLIQDARYAVRSLRRTPGFLAAAVATLALGIGANTAIFSLMNAVLFRTLPVASPHDLYFVAHGPTDDLFSTSSNYVWLEAVREHTEVFAGATVYNVRDFKTESDQGVEVVAGQYAAGNYHAVVGAPMALGRGFTTEDDRSPGSSPIAVISDSFWTRRFGRDPKAIGQTLVVGGQPVTIVGITARGFHGMRPGRRIEITLPLSMLAQQDRDFLTWPDSWYVMPIVVRLKPGTDLRQAQSVLQMAFRTHVARPELQNFARLGDGRPREATLQPAARGQDRLRNDYEVPLTVLMAMVGVVLLVGCVNVASLLAVRGTARAREVAVRMSAGATRGRLVRQFLTESLILSIGGGGIGVILASWGTQFVSTLFLENQNPVAIDLQPDTTVLLFAIGLSLLTGLAFGSMPAWGSTHIDLATTLKKGSAGWITSPRWSRQKALVAAQIAFSLVLVFAAALLVRTERNVQGVDGGFTTNVLMFSLDAEDTAVPGERMIGLCRDAVNRLRRSGSAGACSTMTPVDTAFERRLLGMPGPEPAEVFVNTVTPEYFSTFGIGLIRGRLFTEQDTSAAPGVAIISDTLARAIFANRDPIGQLIAFGRKPDPSRTLTVVGVVRDMRQARRDLLPSDTVYQPLAQSREAPEHLIASIRTAGDLTPLAATVRQEVRSLDAGVGIMWVRTMRQQIAAATTTERLLATLSTFFAVLALFLACIGLYGVISYDVANRTRDIGIRLALGADRSMVLASVLRQTGTIIAIGLAAGLMAASVTSQLVERLLFGLTSRDPVTLAAAAVTLGGAALLAGFFPARRASRIDPALALRSE